jgi:uncharacterized RDD family membrane protein YckC
MIAMFIDHLLAFALMLVIVALVPQEFPNVKAVFFFLFYLAYFIVLEALWSRTLGKYFQGLVVRKLDGSRCDWRASIIRNVLRVVEVNPLLFGGLPAGIAILLSQRKQRIGDWLAGTLVVSSKLKWESDEAPMLPAPPPPPAFLGKASADKESGHD